MNLAYRLVNVFTIGDDPFSGNPLAVFEDGSGLSSEQMQAIARQLNLSETTFVCGLEPVDDDVDATVRVFTPSYELPFAGHPTLGTAYVVVDLLGGGRADVSLRMPAGRVPVSVTDAVWTLTAAVEPSVWDVDASAAEVAAMVGLEGSDLTEEPLWVTTGIEQLLIPVRSADAVRRAVADPRLLRVHGRSPLDESLVYLWAPTADESIEARLFFTQGGGVVEDPATGSACANLGGWFHHRGERGLRRTIRQGDAVQRPSLLQLEVSVDGAVRVGGTVHELGTGILRL